MPTKSDSSVDIRGVRPGVNVFPVRVEHEPSVLTKLINALLELLDVPLLRRHPLTVLLVTPSSSATRSLHLQFRLRIRRQLLW